MATNTAPVANAGYAQNVRVGTLVTLDGSASRDADGDALTYSWVLTVPTGSAARLSDASSPKPSFTADVTGSYTAALVVSDGKASSATATVSVVSAAQNSAPVSHAGAAQDVVVGSVVTLDGSGSTDADGDLLAYDWILVRTPSGSRATLAAPSSARPSFTADVAGDYLLSLSVFDGKVYSATDSVKVSAAPANVAPVAHAGATQNVTVGTVVTLDGSGSSDANGDQITYQWVLTSKPASSRAVLSSSTVAKPTFTADMVGIYVATLVVSDGKLSSAPSTVPVTAARGNSAPVAIAGSELNIVVGSLATLDATASYDVDGDPLTYRWTLVSKPATSAVAIASPNAPLATFTADAVGTYVANLVVNDGKLDSQPARVTVTAAVANVAPVASAGAAQSVATGALVTLDGSGSSDANGDALSYKWALTSVPAGSRAVLSSTSTVRPTFSADVAGIYVASLLVNDGSLWSAVATVPVTASGTNVAPVANAGVAQNVPVNTVVTLDGSGSSDVDGDQITYQWWLTGKPAGSQATLSSPTSAMPTFAADVSGIYVATLVVSDGKLSSAPATVPVTAARGNSAPVAVAGVAQNVIVGSLVTLDATTSYDVDGDPLTYRWTLVSKPANSTATIFSPDVPRTLFIADLAGSYVANLVVNDGKLDSQASKVIVTAAVANVAPVANAGTAQNVSTGAVVTLDGSGSSDANGDALTYRWTLTSAPAGSQAALSSTSAVRPTFTADAAGVYVASLLVSDGRLWSTVATVPITASATNSPPVAVAGPAQTVAAGAVVTLDGRGSYDADGDTLSYQWILTSKPTGSAAVLSSTTAPKPTFTADLPGVYVASLIVSDGKDKSIVATVPITAN